MDRLGRGTSGANNNNDNNNTSGGGTLFGPGTYPPSLPSIEDLLDGGPRPPPPPPPAPSINGNLFSDVSSDLPTANNFDVLTTKRAPPTIWSKGSTIICLVLKQLLLLETHPRQKLNKM